MYGVTFRMLTRSSTGPICTRNVPLRNTSVTSNGPCMVTLAYVLVCYALVPCLRRGTYVVYAYYFHVYYYT